jgi:hypothetical protein
VYVAGLPKGRLDDHVMSSPQNVNLTAIWITRGSSAEVMVPNAADPKTPLGAPN